MKKPEKKGFKDSKSERTTLRRHGYNQACEDWEKYHKQQMIASERIGLKNVEIVANLPSEEEILEIVKGLNRSIYPPEDYVIAKAIYKRIRGE